MRQLAILIALSAALAAALPASSASFGEPQRLTASDAEAGDFLGLGVAVSGGTAIAGAAGGDAGAAYIFRRNADGWSQSAVIAGSDGAAEDFFGLSVAIDGDTAIAGAPGHDAQGEDAGAAYVFERNATGWTETAKLVASDAERQDEFGYSVDIEGDTAVVGAFFEDAGGANAGAAYVFERDAGGAWTEVAQLAAPGAGPGDEFGISLAIDEDTIVVGAIHEGAGGAVHVFQRNAGGPNAWGHVARLTPAVAGGGDRFGSSVAIDGGTIVVAAFFVDAAFVFESTVDGWSEVARLTVADAGTDVAFAGDVAIAGGAIVVGASRIAGTGAAYLYESAADGWVEAKQITAPDLGPGDSFGDGVAIGPGAIVVGASSSDAAGQDAGAVYVFDRLGKLSGDVDCDGVVSVIDAALLLQLDAGLLAALPCPVNGDANADGRSDAGDAAIILRMRAGLAASSSAR